MRKSATLLVSCALALAAFTPAVAADTASLTLTAPKSAKFGKAVTFTGKVTVNGQPAAGADVVVEAWIPPKGGWQMVGAATARGDGSYRIRTKVHFDTKLRAYSIVDDVGYVTSSPITVKLTTGTKTQRAVMDAALKLCRKWAAPDVALSGVKISGGPKEIKVSGGKYARGAGTCLDGQGQVAWGGAVTFWLKKAGTWRLYYATQNTVECKKFDRKGWPVRLTGNKCSTYDGTGTTRNILR